MQEMMGKERKNMYSNMSSFKLNILLEILNASTSQKKMLQF